MKKLILLSALLIFACSSDDGDGDGVNCDVVYLDSNGITIKACENAQVGESGIVNGITYTIIDNETLVNMIDNSEDLTKISTSRITDMEGMFYAAESFNQDIGSWDVSNVTDMNDMFYLAESFNQDIGSWDVSNVTDMSYMFFQSVFNQNLNSWDVENVTECINFSQLNFNWTLPKPNFTDCNPNYQ